MITKEHIELADRHIAESEESNGRQKKLIERIRQRGEDTRAAERVLTLLTEGLKRFRAHRDMIIKYRTDP